MPSVSIGDGSAEPHLAPIYCRHPLFWRSVTLQVPVDARTARRIRAVVWAWRAAFSLIGLLFLLSTIDLFTFDDPDRSSWPLVLRFACLVGMLVVLGVTIALRRSPTGKSAFGTVEIRNVDPTAAREWVELNPPGAVIVSDWQGVWFQPVQAP